MTAASLLSSAANPLAGSAPDGAQSLLRMAVGPEVLAVPIEHVREILEVSRLTPLPRTPPFVRGVMNLRGAVVPVIDLSARLGLPPTTLGRRSCIVVVEAPHAGTLDEAAETLEEVSGSLVVGLLVDAVFEVFDTSTARIEPVPALGTRIAAEMLAGMARARGEVIGLLALSRVLSQTDLTEMIARHSAH
ncbi:MAG: chemotaxis protein CheW [Rubrivivax sp.]|nr:chemotaxis protein CheW [Rubrivivax sp.]